MNARNLTCLSVVCTLSQAVAHADRVANWSSIFDDRYYHKTDWSERGAPGWSTSEVSSELCRSTQSQDMSIHVKPSKREYRFDMKNT